MITDSNQACFAKMTGINKEEICTKDFTCHSMENGVEKFIYFVRQFQRFLVIQPIPTF